LIAELLQPACGKSFLNILQCGPFWHMITHCLLC
jgi:hypothetical protein